MTSAYPLTATEIVIIHAMKRLPRFCYIREIIVKVHDLRGRKMEAAVALAALNRMEKNGLVSYFQCGATGNEYESSFYLTKDGEGVF